MTYCWNKSAISTVLCPVEHLYIDLYEWKKNRNTLSPLNIPQNIVKQKAGRQKSG